MPTSTLGSAIKFAMTYPILSGNVYFDVTGIPSSMNQFSPVGN
jgi:hypothetical protein